MKKFLGIVVLGWLLSNCSVDKSVKSITNCADHYYSKNNKRSITSNFTELLYANKDPENSLEKKIVVLSRAGFSDLEILEWLSDLQNIKLPLKNKYEKNLKGATIEEIKLAQKIPKENNKKMKKFISSNLNVKLENETYERYFMRCEFQRKETPKTFDSKWRRAKVVYNKIK